jgi:hypothetical protein
MLNTFFFELKPSAGAEYLGQEAMIGQYAQPLDVPQPLPQASKIADPIRCKPIIRFSLLLPLGERWSDQFRSSSGSGWNTDTIHTVSRQEASCKAPQID